MFLFVDSRNEFSFIDSGDEVLDVGTDLWLIIFILLSDFDCWALSDSHLWALSDSELWGTSLIGTSCLQDGLDVVVRSTGQGSNLGFA